MNKRCLQIRIIFQKHPIFVPGHLKRFRAIDATFKGNWEAKSLMDVLQFSCKSRWKFAVCKEITDRPYLQDRVYLQHISVHSNFDVFKKMDLSAHSKTCEAKPSSPLITSTAEEATAPTLFSALQVYSPTSLWSTLLITKEAMLFLNCILYAGADRSFVCSLYQEILISGVPSTLHCKVVGSPMAASTCSRGSIK